MIEVKLRFKYQDDSTRLYSFDCDNALAPDVKDNVKAVNTSLRGGTDGGLSSFFVGNDGDYLVLIDGATLESSQVVPIEITAG